jgi:hypothetical protein
MFRGRISFPADLEVMLESPLASAAPFSALGGFPGSAIAERIFNDPDSWEDTDGDDGDYPEDVEDDTLAWLTEEIEKIRIQSASAGVNGAFPVPLLEKRDSKDSSLLPAPEIGEDNGDWKGIARRGSVRPISLAGLFEQPNDDFSADIQQHLSKILESGGIKHHIGPRPLSASIQTPSTGASSSTVASPPITPAIPSGILGGASPALPTSSTLSFLEYYGIYPESPLLDGRKVSILRKKSMRQKNSALRVPAPHPSTRPPSLTLAPPAPATTASRRFSPISPPGLERPSSFGASPLRPSTPPRRSNSPANRGQNSLPAPTSPSQSNGPEQVIEVHLPSQTQSTPRSRPLPTASPAYFQTPPAERTSHETTPSRVNLSGSPPIRRRLPTIPPETLPQPKSPPATPPGSCVKERKASPPPPAPAQRAATAPSTLSPPASTAVPQSFASFGLATGHSAHFGAYPPTSCGSATSGRPASTIRSPLGGPIGPRTRLRGSSAEHALPHARPVGPAGHRPPVLRL